LEVLSPARLSIKSGQEPKDKKKEKCHESVYSTINYLVSANCLFSYDSHWGFLN
jgi:hypothetical protein